MSKSIAVRYRNKSKANIWLDGVKNVLILLSLRIKRQTYFVYGVFFIVSSLFIILFDKFFLHLKINQIHTSFLDTFFKYSTFLGDGVMFGVLALFFVFVKRRIVLVFLISGVLTLLVTHFFKKIIFKGIPRPVGVFGEDSLYLVKGVKMALWNSFPSGHTTTAFAIFTILCLYFAKCKSQYLWISLAIVAGLSRVYLSQHFLIDVFVGSFIGIVIGFISMGLLYKHGRGI
ncbi:phosphatase PAP2 family protein [Tenacibaculum sp. nBUS_03]|uniref:phosphatase PAP2 family protein n=1 Tax=Tenacibaculum sp. nBUS_03 TaxID=3395320 RepID=UPI003EBC5C1D